ncbi:MAG TPA: MAPEG family protein [Burkholderiales bacterium]|nr:MAPEG family protein [Burkholderiales bacterium]
MRPELTLLVWAVALTVVQMLVAAQGAFMQVGLMRLVGNREGMPEITGWGGRASRAHWNMLENLVLFAALVLVAVAVGKANDMTLLGAQIFFWARLAYAVIYIAGIIWVRTLVWLVSVIGLVLIFAQLVK